MPETWKFTLEPDRYGREQSRDVNLTIDIRDFKDNAGFVYLLIAANPQLSIRDIQDIATAVNANHHRPVGWLSRRRWLFHGLGKPGLKPNIDGRDEQARALMAEHPNLSSRETVQLLRESGIVRSREWVRQHRN